MFMFIFKKSSKFSTNLIIDNRKEQKVFQMLQCLQLFMQIVPKKKKKIIKKTLINQKENRILTLKKKTGTNSEINKYALKKSHTFNSKSKNIFIPDKTIKIEDANYENILKKSKSLVFEKANTFKKFKAVLETIHEESDSKIDSSELSDFKDEIHKDDKDDNINDNNG